ncbi:MAG: TM0106 family RecB-like putative nuclease, partial [Gemmatimonadales bacterium]|nr:TM0106 family RecB-like putative nuclease [Gemmatimonadales bacterium]
PDFLFRCADGNGPPCACRAWHYTPWDTKLARSAKPYFLIQLCAYADMLEDIRGFRPGEVVFVMGQGEERAYPTGHFFYYYRQLRRSFSAFQSQWDKARVPDPGLDRSWGRWEKAAEKLLASSDHLSRVTSITRGQVRRLEEAGIATLTALAGCEPQRRVPKVSEQVFDRMRAQARLQLESSGRPLPCWQHRPPVADEPRRGLAQLPARSDADVFFDMEGFPYAENGLEYLFGAVTVDDVAPVFHEWWAHDAQEERAAFEGFIDWLVARRRRDPSLHVYHYAAYEESAVKRLMGKYATREAEVDDLLRGGVFVDLYRVVQQGFVVGTPSYSLKDIERLYLPRRTGPVLSAGGSVVEYQRWIDSGESRKWEDSPLLRGIRGYNRVDCESLWGLRSWLLDRQRESGIAYCHPERSEGSSRTVPETRGQDPSVAPLPQDDTVDVRLLDRAKATPDPEAARLDQLIAWLVNFHRREEKPMWWRMFDRHEMTIEDRYGDRDCLAALTRTATPPTRIKRSLGLEYRYDPAQETKLRPGDKCFAAGTELRAEIVRMDEGAGLVELKAGKPLPDRLCLIPDEFVSAEPIRQAVVRYAEAWERGEVSSAAVDDLLRRRPPRITGHAGGPLVGATEDFVERVCDLAARLDRSTLCIQGPPGTGKTYTAAAMIVELLRRGCRVGITAQSHKVIMNAMGAVAKALERSGLAATLCKVGDHDDDPLVEQGIVREIENDDVPGVLDGGACLVGATAWLFSREELAGRFDYLFIDEAGQVSLANAVAVGLSTRNLILVGDQMQLSQVTQGHHPGDTGLSCLEYL